MFFRSLFNLPICQVHTMCGGGSRRNTPAPPIIKQSERSGQGCGQPQNSGCSVDGAGGQLRHSAADGQLLQGLAQVFLAGEHAGHAVQRLADLNLFIGSADVGVGLFFHADIPPS